MNRQNNAQKHEQDITSNFLNEEVKLNMSLHENSVSGEITGSHGAEYDDD
jgi:hypothetical protein